MFSVNKKDEVQMSNNFLSKHTQIYLEKICKKISNRCVGSIGNRQATDFFAETIASFGFQVKKSEFNCIDWFHEGEQWFQGDHMIFVPNKVPAMAITSNNLFEILTEIAHTPKDIPEIVDISKLTDVAEALQDLVYKLNNKVLF
jgi:hypothetical protein